MLFTLDLETTTDVDDCRAWAWGVCEIGNPENFHYGNSLDTLFQFMKDCYNATFFIHNMKFDMDFLFVYLFEHGYTLAKPKKINGKQVVDEKTKTFTTVISDMGQFYSAKIIFKKQGKRTQYAKIYDSLKMLPFSVDAVAKSFGLPLNKLHLDYKTFREVGHELTDHEVKYLRHDVEIMARALQVLFDQGQDKKTQASNAFSDFQARFGKEEFAKYFPAPDYQHDQDMRQAYRGGYTYVSPKYKGVNIREGLVLDVNSLYPSVMRNCPMPYGAGRPFTGKYEPDPIYTTYIQMFSCVFELKPGKLPTVQLKNNPRFKGTEYLESSGGKPVVLCMTQPDYELFCDHYKVIMPEYINGWKFKSATGLFNTYIDYWMEQKNEAKATKNKGLYTLSKLMLNALYGRFALNPNVQNKYPVYDNGMIRFEMGEKDTRAPVYIPVGAFVTAWGRNRTIRSAQKVYELFAYADTDSLHLSIELPEALRDMDEDELEKLTTADLQRYGVPLPDDFEVDPYMIGAWKVESKFNRARFIRQKSYIEDNNPPELWDALPFHSTEYKEICEELEMNFDTVMKNYVNFYDRAKMKITCAGMPSRCYDQVTWENFRVGATYSGKLQPKHVKGGIVLVDCDFTIKGY